MSGAAYPAAPTAITPPAANSGRSSGFFESSTGNTSSHAYSFGGRSKAVMMNIAISVPIPMQSSVLPPGRWRILNNAPHITTAAPIE